MMVVCSLSALLRTALFIVALALVAGISLVGLSTSVGTPGQGRPATTTSESVER